MTTRDILDALGELGPNVDAASKFSVAGVEAARQLGELVERVLEKVTAEEAFDRSAGVNAAVEPTDLREFSKDCTDHIWRLVLHRAANQIERERLAAGDQVDAVRKAGQASEDAHAADVAALADVRRKLDELKAANLELALDPLSRLRTQFPSAHITLHMPGKEQ